MNEALSFPVNILQSDSLQAPIHPKSKKDAQLTSHFVNVEDDDHFDRRQQRRRTDSAPVPLRFRRQFLSLADSPLRRWSEEVTSIARLVADNYDDEQLRNNFFSLSLQLVLEQPLKTPFIAAVAVVANAMKPELMEGILARLATQIEEHVGKGLWREVKLLLKYLACMQSCLEENGVFPLLEELFMRAADLQTASSDDVSISSLSFSQVSPLSPSISFLLRRSDRTANRC